MSYPRIRVSNRWTVEELESAAKAEREGRVRTRILALRHLLQGSTTAQTAQVFVISESQLRLWVHRYNAEGIEGLRDRPRSGRPALLDTAQVQPLKERLRQGLPGAARSANLPATDIRKLLADEFGASYSHSGTYGLLRRLGFGRGIPQAGRRRKRSVKTFR